MTRGTARPRVAPRTIQGAPTQHRLEFLQLTSAQLRAFDMPSGPPQLTRRSRAAGIGNGLRILQKELTRSSELAETPDPRRAFLQNEAIAEFFDDLVEFEQAISLVGSRDERLWYAWGLRGVLEDMEDRAYALLRATEGMRLPHVIVSEELLRQVPGAYRQTARRKTPDAFSERPWFWEARFWNVDYNQEQMRLRQERYARNSTGVPIPKPRLVADPRGLRALRDWFQHRGACTPGDRYGRRYHASR